MQFRVIIDKERCKGCALCLEACSRGLLRMSEDLNARGSRFVESDTPHSCKGCLLCATMCPDAALQIVEDTEGADSSGAPERESAKPASIPAPEPATPAGCASRASFLSSASDAPLADRVLMSGNDAIAEGAIRAGCDAYYGYPITPQNELTAYMAKHMPEHGRVFIQAESEIAAISMVYGSSAAGKRTMTSSSSPGISLKQEGISYIAGSELPSVIVNIQRGGPGLGNIAPAQSDYFQATRGGGHGDYRMPVLAPNSVQEMHDLTILAFELADAYRSPVMLLADGRLGQMMEPVVLHEGTPPPLPEKPWALTGARGRPPNRIQSFFLYDGELENHNLHLQEKFRDIVAREVRCEERDADGCDLLIVAYGTSARVVKGALDLYDFKPLKVGLLRPITLWPFPSNRIQTLASDAKHVLAVEMSSGQMLEDVLLAVNGRIPVGFLGRMGGGVPSPEDVVRKIEELTGIRAKTRDQVPS